MNDIIDELGGFEQRLLAELRSEIDTAPAPAPRRHRTRLVLAGAAAVAAAGTAIPLLLGGSAAQQAYAVSTGDDGTVTVTVYRIDDAAGLQRQLRAHGVSAVVDYTPEGKMCRAPRYTPTTINGLVSIGTDARTSTNSFSFTVTPAQFRGHTLVLELSGEIDSRVHPGTTMIDIGFTDGAVAPCVLVPAPAGNQPPPVPSGAVVSGSGPASGLQTGG